MKMLSNFSDTAILTKIRAMYGNRLMPQDYTELLHKQTVGDVAAYLKNQTHYRDVLAQTQESQVHRGQLEHMIHMELFQQYQRILRFCKSGNPFYEDLLPYVEVRLINERLGYFYTGIRQEDISGFPSYLSKYLCFNSLELMRAEDFSQVLKVLEHTPYYRVLKPLTPPKGEKPDLLRCEKALGVMLYDLRFSVVQQRFHGATRKNLNAIYSTQMELMNVTTIYRMKRFGGYTPQEIQAQLIPSHNRVESKLWQQMIEAPTVEGAMALLSKSRYSKYLDGDYTFIEYTAQAIHYHLSKRFMTFATDAPTGFAAFLVLSQLEQQNITNVIEGIRYQIAPEEIEKLLIL